MDEAQACCGCLCNGNRRTDGVDRKRAYSSFSMSEPEFLISCLNRHTDWATVVCLVGGGQEINTGEAGIREWLNALGRSFPNWRLYISSSLTDSEYAAGEVIERCKTLPILLTRDLDKAKQWLREKARGNERYGLLASSNAYRLKPHAIDVRLQVDPVQWFLYGKDDVRSSYYLEDAATEYRVQGLELDWACVTWDADFRRVQDGWGHWKFVGDGWNRVRKPERQMYLKNTYRVLLTRARQGMVIVVPTGALSDPTRKQQFYDPTFEYLRAIGFPIL